MPDHSDLPAGSLDPTYASNLLLDGFDFDTDYGAGPEAVRTDPRLPRSTRGLSGLPDGIVTAAQNDLTYNLMEQGEEYGLGDLEEHVREPHFLTDLSWLEGAVQDPDRLPHSTNDTIIPELQEAWGVHRRTDGRGLVPNRVVEPVHGGPGAPRSRLPGTDTVRSLVAEAMRRSAYGESLDSIALKAAQALGPAVAHLHTDPKLQRLVRAMAGVRAEHGLAGRVFLRATAFPGLLTGKWDRVVRARCAGARYWVAPPGSELLRMGNYLGKRVVTEVPWDEALAHYQPQLELKGVKAAAGGTPKEILRRAFLARIPTPKFAFPFREKAPLSGEGVSLEEAWQLLKGAASTRPLVLPRGPSPRQVKAVEKALTRWVQSGQLKKSDADRLRGLRNLTLKEKLRAASQLVAAAQVARTGTYQGSGQGVSSAPRPAPSRDQVWARVQEEALRGEEKARASRVVSGLFSSGQLTHKEARALLDHPNLAPREMVRLAQSLAGDVNRRAAIPAVERRNYAGTRYVEAPAHPPLRATTPEVARAEELRVAAALRSRAESRVDEMVRAGNLSARDASRLKGAGVEPGEMLRLAQLRVEQNAGRMSGPAPVARYQGRAYTLHQAQKVALPELAPGPTRRATLPATSPSMGAPQFDPTEFGLQAPGSLDFEDTASPEFLEEVAFGGTYLED